MTKNYIPSHQRDGFDESKIEVLPSGWSGQRTDHWGNVKNITNKQQRISATKRLWNKENYK